MGAKQKWQLAPRNELGGLSRQGEFKIGVREHSGGDAGIRLTLAPTNQSANPQSTCG